ncbi:MAG: hypothetical protein A3J99_03265 [Sideroxydans sp. RIFOXYD2_FULL_59_7]|nr:MAG: hypothetical protein A3J99_03265 [Sideroxydans sp. RIFOXYD2_FULL_59_7]
MQKTGQIGMPQLERLLESPETILVDADDDHIVLHRCRGALMQKIELSIQYLPAQAVTGLEI